MSSLQPFSVDNTWTNVVVKRSGDKREYGGDNLSSELSSNFLPTDVTDKTPSSPGLFSDQATSQFMAYDLPSSPVRKKRLLGGVQFTEKGKNKENEEDEADDEYDREEEDTFTESKTEHKKTAGAVSLNSQTAKRPSLAAPTTPYRPYSHQSSYGSLGSFGETGAGITAEVASPEPRASTTLDSSLPPGKYLLQCAYKEVENIDLMFRGLDKLPKEFSELKNVVKSSDNPCVASLTMSYKVMLSQNRLDELPPVLFDGINIVNLSVFNNQLKSVPPRIKDLANLDTLNVSGNPDLKFLPSDILQLKKLRNLKAQNVGFPPLPPGAKPLTPKSRLMLHREFIVTNPDKLFPSLIELIVKSMFKAKNGPLTDAQIAHLDVHQMGRQYFEDAQRSYLLGNTCGLCKEHILFEDMVYGHALEWWQWPAHEESSAHDQQVVVLRRLYCKKVCMDRGREK